MPSFFFNKKHFFNYLLHNLDLNFTQFDDFLHYSKSEFNSQINNLTENIDDNLELLEQNHFNQILKDISKKYRKNLNIKKQKNKFNPETLELRNNVQSFFLKDFSNLKYENNLSYHQYEALISFKKNKPFTVIDCDKNVGSAIISNDLYQTSVINYIRSDPAYRELTTNPLSATVNLINEKLLNLFNNGSISNKLKNSLSINLKYAKLGSIRLMAKVHKANFDWRAIINCQNHPTSKIAIFFDLLIKPIIISSETYLKDSQNLIQIFENLRFDQKPKIFSFDVTSLYPSIDPFIAIPFITEYLDNNNHLDYNHLSPSGFKSLLELFFSNNIFKFMDKFFVQILGVPMGCICGPSIANIFLYILEMKWAVIYRPLVYKRYIDDGLLITDKDFDFDHFKSFFFNLNFTITTGEVVNYLDLNISFNSATNKMKCSLYTKPTHVNKYLLPQSNHPQHIFRNIPISLFIRLRRICSDYYDFTGASGRLISQLLERGYNSKKIRASFFIVSNTDRFSLIPYKVKPKNIDFSKHILFFSNFNYNIIKLNNYLFTSFKNTCNSFPLLNNFSLKIVNKIDYNLNSLFVHNFKLPNYASYSTIKCNSCNICDYIFKSSFIKLKNSDISVNFLCNSNCQTNNIVYIIICLRCNIFYIGETEKTLSFRISQHINHINKFKCFKKYHDKEVANHFNLKGHKITDHFRCCVFNSGFFNAEKRKSAEMDLVNFFNLNYDKCINIRKTNKINSLTFN